MGDNTPLPLPRGVAFEDGRLPGSWLSVSGPAPTQPSLSSEPRALAGQGRDVTAAAFPSKPRCWQRQGIGLRRHCGALEWLLGTAQGYAAGQSIRPTDVCCTTRTEERSTEAVSTRPWSQRQRPLSYSP